MVPDFFVMRPKSGRSSRPCVPLSIWQQNIKRWVVKVKKTLRRQTWRERIVANGKRDPLVCPKCECYYEYKGEVCLENGKLEIKVALCATTRAYLERVIEHLTSIQTPPKREEKEEKYLPQSNHETERQLCLFSVS